MKEFNTGIIVTLAILAALFFAIDACRRSPRLRFYAALLIVTTVIGYAPLLAEASWSPPFILVSAVLFILRGSMVRKYQPKCLKP